MSKVKQLVCSVCGESYEPDEVMYVCPADGGNLTVQLDIEKIKNELSQEDIFQSVDDSMWRYLPLLPTDDPGYSGTTLRQVGWTPVYEPLKLVEELGLRRLWIKDESSNPTASFKDRASALMVAKGLELDVDVITTASSGNAGAALAGMAASVGQKTVILVPKSAPPPKIAQLRVYGAQVVLVDGTYDDAFDLTLEASEAFGWYCRNTGYNPYTAEGKKTAGYEIWEQVLSTTSLDKPLCVFVSVGDGNIISGIQKGFQDLVELGWLNEMPRMFGVQAEGAAALVNAYQSGVESIEAVKANTLADSISVGLPRDGLRALRAVTQTKGAYIAVSDEDILEAIAQLGKVGIFAEPAGAAGFAGLVKGIGEGLIQKDDPVLVMVTGSGLKDSHAAIRAVGEAPVTAPNLEALKEVVKLDE